MNQGQFEQFASAMLGTTPQQATCLFDAAKTNPGLALMFTEGKPASEKPTLEAEGGADASYAANFAGFTYVAPNK